MSFTTFEKVVLGLGLRGLTRSSNGPSFRPGRGHRLHVVTEEQGVSPSRLALSPSLYQHAVLEMEAAERAFHDELTYRLIAALEKRARALCVS